MEDSVINVSVTIMFSKGFGGGNHWDMVGASEKDQESRSKS